MRCLLIIFMMFLSLVSCKEEETNKPINIGEMVQPIPLKNRMFNPDYNIWGASVIKGFDNKYHMYYSRWPKKLGHMAWVTDSEIAYAVANKPEGPYKFVNVALPKRGVNYWDGTTTHNPTIIKKQGKYYLYYMGTTSPVKAEQPTSMKKKDWWIYRNNQRIGVAVAENPKGPWKRLDKPVLDVSENSKAYDALLTSNPAVNFDDKGNVIMLYKAVEKTDNYNPVDMNSTDSYKVSVGGKVRFMVAFADNPLGPFKKHSEPIFELKEFEKERMIAEDPYVWSENGTYYAVVCDIKGYFTEDEGAFALMTSENGYDWKGAENPLVLHSKFKFADGTLSKLKLERPQILIEDGKPTYLFGALGINENGVHRAHACNVFVPLKSNKH